MKTIFGVSEVSVSITSRKNPTEFWGWIIFNMFFSLSIPKISKQNVAITKNQYVSVLQTLFEKIWRYSTLANQKQISQNGKVWVVITEFSGEIWKYIHCQ